MRARCLVVLLASSLAGCSDGLPTLSVDLRSDLLAGGATPEIDRACVEITPADAMREPITSCVALDESSNLLAGVRVAEVELAPGDYELRTSVELAGSVVLEATTHTTLIGTTVSTVLLSRRCGPPGGPRVVCPRPGDDPSHTLCIDPGICVDPRCTPEHPEFCPGAGCDGGTGVWFVDCDGDGFPNATGRSETSCAPPAPDACGGGWTEVVPGLGTADCDDSRSDIAPSQPELCDGVDNDCNGLIDDGMGCRALSSEACTTSCGSTGTRTCSAACEWSACTPPAEVCDGVDNDCSGSTDEAWACAAGAVRMDDVCEIGPCQRTCDASCSWPSQCTPARPVWMHPAASSGLVDHSCGAACYTSSWCADAVGCANMVIAPAPYGLLLPPGRFTFTATLWAPSAGDAFQLDVMRVRSGAGLVYFPIAQLRVVPTNVFPGEPFQIPFDVPATDPPCNDSYALFVHWLGGATPGAAIHDVSLEGPPSIAWP